MEKQFVPYELAVKLKELGFDDLCLARFNGGGFYMLPAYDPLRNSEIKEPWFCTAPLWQQAFDWFRTNHDIIAWINPSYSCYNLNIVKYNKIKDKNINIADGLEFKDFISYEECLKECLEKMIKILENERKTEI